MYSAVLLNDVLLGRDHNVEQRLWALYYTDIQEAKAAITKTKASFSESLLRLHARKNWRCRERGTQARQSDMRAAVPIL